MYTGSSSSGQEKYPPLLEKPEKTVSAAGIAVVVFIAVVAFVLGIVGGYFIPYKKSDELFVEDWKQVTQQILDTVDAASISRFLRNLTREPHLAGRSGDLKTAKYVLNAWQEHGLDKAVLVPYKVLLSYPDENNPNNITIVEDGEVVATIAPRETPLQAPEEADPNIVPPFAAYSAAGNVVGDLVYVNYGQLEDFNYLEQQGVNISGKIAIARYAKIFRANIAAFAQQYDAIGLIVFSDPFDYAPYGSNDTYPNSFYLPESGVQRGTYMTTNGDPLTPFYPSIDGIYRIPEENATLPKIPIHVVSYHDAFTLLSNMSGPEAPENWRGGLNLAYHVGPGYTIPNRQVNLVVNSQRINSTIYNVIGIIHGRTEPDRFVIVGNHRDAWTLGAADPNSGTASMLEMSRVFGKLLKKGWRPRRSIVFCSWGGEEYGLLGSNEWTEEFQKQLTAGAVAYLNVDTAVRGNFSFDAKASPPLYKIIWESAKKIPNPNPEERDAGRTTLYDTWAYNFPWASAFEGKPKITTLGSGSDYATFIHGLGITAADLRFTCQPGNVSCYPVYHSLYETYFYVDQIMDRGFLYHKAITQVWGEITWSLADSAILPYSIMDYALDISDKFKNLKKEYSPFIGRNLTLDYFENATLSFIEAARKFDEEVSKVDRRKLYEVRQINDQLMQVERAFIDILGLPWRKDYRHVVQSPSSFDSYSARDFAGLTDVLYQMKFVDGPIPSYLWAEARQQLSSIVFHIQAATSVLERKLWRNTREL